MDQITKFNAILHSAMWYLMPFGGIANVILAMVLIHHARNPQIRSARAAQDSIGRHMWEWLTPFRSLIAALLIVLYTCYLCWRTYWS